MSRAVVALLTEIPAPYRIPLFNALAAEEDVELHVVFLSERDPKRPYPVYADEFRFAWRVLPRWEVTRRGRWVVLSRGVLRSLVDLSPDVVIVGGWNQPAFWQAALYARLRRVPYAVWVESTARDERPGLLRLELAKRAFLRAAAACIVPGRASAAYVQSLGVSERTTAVAPNAADLEIFGRRVAEARRRREEIRAELGITRTTFLYVGRLDPEKSVDLLLEAVAQVAADVVIAGSGRDEERLRARAPANARFLGRLERDALVPWYAAADAFVLPSRSEQWGIVLNEAAAAGLPIVATDAAGAAHELVENRANGFVVRAGDMAALRNALVRTAADTEFRSRASQRSIELSERFTPEAWAQAVAGLATRLAGSA